MTDINEQVRSPRTDTVSAPRRPGERADGLEAADPALLDLAELLFFAYRDFTAEPDAVLAEFGFGRAHHRVLHFVNRHPGLTVADLLDILKITKQSLGRVLKQLVDEGYIEQRAGEADRRQRLLHPTARGKALAERLATLQLERISRALDAAGADAHDRLRNFLSHMIADADRARVFELLERGGAAVSGREKQ